MVASFLTIKRLGNLDPDVVIHFLPQAEKPK
jgi:hypothetical protein